MAPLHAELQASLLTVSKLQSKAVKDGTFVAYGLTLERFAEWIRLNHPSVDDLRQLDILLCCNADVLYYENPDGVSGN